MEITIPVTLLISLATLLITVCGTWILTQHRIKALEEKVSKQDLKYEQLIIEINGLKIEINGLKVEIAKVQTGISSLNEKLELIIQGKIKY